MPPNAAKGSVLLVSRGAEPYQYQVLPMWMTSLPCAWSGLPLSS